MPTHVCPVNISRPLKKLPSPSKEWNGQVKLVKSKARNDDIFDDE